MPRTTLWSFRAKAYTEDTFHFLDSAPALDIYSSPNYKSTQSTLILGDRRITQSSVASTLYGNGDVNRSQIPPFGSQLLSAHELGMTKKNNCVRDFLAIDVAWTHRRRTARAHTIISLQKL